MPQHTSIPAWTGAVQKRPADAPLPLALCWALWIGASLILWAALLAVFAG